MNWEPLFFFITRGIITIREKTLNFFKKFIFPFDFNSLTCNNCTLENFFSLSVFYLDIDSLNLFGY